MARASLKQLIREPLVHFVVLGAAIFGAYHLLNRGTASDPQDIVVTRGVVENLAATFERTWHRPPTDDELQGLIREYVREEAAYREAVALGLDRDDAVVRRRLRQKLEFVAEDIAQTEPTDQDLRAYFAAHPDDFATEREFTFEHVFLSPDRHGDNLGADAEALRARLSRPGYSAPADLADLGDPFLLPHQFDVVPADELRNMFGDEFVVRLSQLPIGEWQGPVESGYGAHVVLVRERTDGRVPAFEEVRGTVRQEWENARRVEAQDLFYQGLVARYRVIVETAGANGAAGAGQ